eukprot:357374_1
MGGNRALTYGGDVVVIGGGDVDFLSMNDINVIRPSGNIVSGGAFPVIIGQYALITTPNSAFIFGGFETYEENFYWYFDFTSPPTTTAYSTTMSATTTISAITSTMTGPVGCEAQGEVKHINWDDLANAKMAH